MKEEIVIDGKNYVLKDSIKEEQEIMDSSNVTMLVKCEEDNHSLIKIKQNKMVFKKASDLEDSMVSYDKKRIILKGSSTRIGYEQVQKSKKILALMNDIKPAQMHMTLYEGWDEKTKKVKKNYPILLYWRGFGMVVAPRVEDD